jgi:hypothetical protein
MMHFYTSVNINYLPKARVLAKTLKEHNPDAYFSLVLYDILPESFRLSDEPFDEVVTTESLRLPVDNLNTWTFKHNPTELGTAIKGQALVNFLKRSEKVVYLDPDIMVFHKLDELEKLLDDYCCVLTPHQLSPDYNTIAIVGNEIGSMLRGSYNFGFYALNNSYNGMRIAAWFRDRLLEYCFDDVPNGLFTDQRWGNLIPAMFENVCIWRNFGANVATWNITNRMVTLEDNRYLVNGSPLLFYHFSGIDSGAQLRVLNLFANNNRHLYEIRDNYVSMMNAEGQDEYAAMCAKFNYYSDGEPITQEARNFLRHNDGVLEGLNNINPYDKTDGEPSFYEIFLYNQQDKSDNAGISQKDRLYLETQIETLSASIDEIMNSTSWKLTAPLRKISALVKGQTGSSK